VNYQLTASDLTAFSRDYERFTPAWLSRLYWSGVLPVLFVVLALASSIGIAVVFSALFVLTNLGISQWQSRLSYRAIFCSDNVAVQTLPMVATLSEEGARFESAAGHILYRWQFIRDVSRVGDYIRFTITPLDRQHIPVAAFRDAAHLKDFLALAKSYAKQPQR
jgi:hypothetical protein